MCIAADETRERTMQLVNKLQAAREPVNLASLYTEYSLQSFYKSDYDEVFNIVSELTFPLGLT